jgi:hypothetical protein
MNMEGRSLASGGLEENNCELECRKKGHSVEREPLCGHGKTRRITARDTAGNFCCFMSKQT